MCRTRWTDSSCTRALQAELRIPEVQAKELSPAGRPFWCLSVLRGRTPFGVSEAAGSVRVAGHGMHEGALIGRAVGFAVGDEALESGSDLLKVADPGVGIGDLLERV